MNGLFFRSRRLTLIALTYTVVLASPLSAVADEASVSYREDVLPILSDRCFRCHGPDAETREAGLRLDHYESSVAVLDSGAVAIVPGDLNGSEVWRRIGATDPDLRMPPDGAGDPLSDQEVDVLRKWIEAGALYEKHWSFTLPQPHALPTSTLNDMSTIGRSFIDVWVHQRLQQQNLRRQPEADRYTLIRRLTLDLVGLPPTLTEVDDFLNDRRPDAYERVVDRLLASPAFGERWARRWLDLARYADSAGYASDPPRIIWRYRDWVIDALNRGLAFDQFTIEQLAGDLLPNPTLQQLIATAFHRNTMTNSEGGTDDEEFRSAAIVDRVNTTMQVWMGLTMGCAQCHSHKYDPITQAEYFQFYAIFNNTEDADQRDEAPFLSEYTEEEENEIQQLDARIRQLETQVDQEQTESSPNTDEKDTDSPETTQAKKDLQAAREQRKKVVGVTTPILRELPIEQRRTTNVHIRGNFRVLGEGVDPGVPQEFFQPHGLAPTNRLEVAEWLVNGKNPLVARVVVNRIWETLFGAGIVETSEDFGTQGEPPTHPELLDHLANELIRTGWNTKRLIRTIVTSATYRQSSAVTPERGQADPRNRWLSHSPSFRLSAEMLRDQALAISGLLSRKMKGPSVRPPRPALGLRAAFGASTDWEASEGEDRYRRGLYTRWRRTTPYPSMATFDAPSREVCTIRRIRTNTPLQAFVTLNDPVFVEAAKALADRMNDPTLPLEERLSRGFRFCLARPPADAELDRLKTLYERTQQAYREDKQAARELLNDDRPAPAERAAMAVVANVLLNLDEVLSKK
ncbi:MAG: hypothetical protein CMJ80_06050 [Planctomycetaceae bacterium]|nr:hypothetical protein [Planctomycetaceae bacterium]